MEIELRPIEPDEFLSFGRAASLGFGGHIEDEEEIKDFEDERKLFEFDRSLAALDGKRIVGTGEIFSFQLTLPGQTTVAAGGVSWITVLPTHRRRGILTRIMRRQFEDVRQRQEPVAILWASESIIYGRFGYGIATLGVEYSITSRHGRFATPPEDSGTVCFVDKDAAGGLLPPIYDRARLLHPGAITRSPEWWEMRLRDSKRSRQGFSAFFIVLHQSTEGEPDGYVMYRIKESWEGGFPGNTLRHNGLVALNPAAYAALWRFVLNIDLVETVEFFGTLDEPLRWLLADPRRLRATRMGDALWVRLVDIPAALSARCYMNTDRLVLEVTDAFLPENSGRYALEGGPDGATCERTDEDADLALQVADLGSTYLGGVDFSVLARAGRVRELSPNALRRADLMFAAEVTPYCETGF